jgi:hypothetical protein
VQSDRLAKNAPTAYFCDPTEPAYKAATERAAAWAENQRQIGELCRANEAFAAIAAGALGIDAQRAEYNSIPYQLNLRAVEDYRRDNPDNPDIRWVREARQLQEARERAQQNDLYGMAKSKCEPDSLRGGDFRISRELALCENGGYCEACNEARSTDGDHFLPVKIWAEWVDAGVYTFDEALVQANDISNVFGLCEACNSAKGAKLMSLTPREGYFFATNPSASLRRQVRIWESGNLWELGPR